MQNILIFNDISGLGNNSMVANVSVFSRLGHYCMPVPTACYSCHTGFDNFTAVKNNDTVDFARRICANAKADAFYVGFCNDTATLQGVQTVVTDILCKDTYLFVDPIMGDNGRLYPVFDDGYVSAMKAVVRQADCITPNLTEACLLADVDYGEIVSHENELSYLKYCADKFCGFLHRVGCKQAVITGVRCGNIIGNIVLDGSQTSVVTNERTDVDFSGTGDAFGSVVLGELLNGVSLKRAAVIAAQFVGNAAKLTERTDRRFGVDFCKLLDALK